MTKARVTQDIQYGNQLVALGEALIEGHRNARRAQERDLFAAFPDLKRDIVTYELIEPELDLLEAVALRTQQASPQRKDK